MKSLHLSVVLSLPLYRKITKKILDSGVSTDQLKKLGGNSAVSTQVLSGRFQQLLPDDKVSEVMHGIFIRDTPCDEVRRHLTYISQMPRNQADDQQFAATLEKLHSSLRDNGVPELYYDTVLPLHHSPYAYTILMDIIVARLCCSY
jgi:hypothetical protein